MKTHTITAAICLAAAVLTGCDDETISLGIPSQADQVQTASELFQFTSRSIRLDSVASASTKSYLGQVRDPETGTLIRADFLAQFYTFENYSLPAEDLLIKNDAGEIEADSVELRLYFTNYYGNGNNPMKIQVMELDTANVMAEGQTYYASTDLMQYVRPGSAPLATKVFTPSDYSLSESERISTTHYDNVRILLPRRLGTDILRKAVHQPGYFANTWQFIHHVCPGFYFRLASGQGTMLAVDVSSFNVYFRYRDAASDSILTGLSRFSATPEVIQSTHIDNQGFSTLLAETDQPYTYLKSPAGIATELTLPIDDIYAAHEGDSISRARIVLTRLNSQTQDQQALDIPASLLLVEKSRQHSFFANHSVADAETSYTASFDKNYNTYTFSNIARLIAHLHRQKLSGMKAEGLTSEQWNQLHPDWNRVVVIPVSITTTTDSSTGSTVQTAVSHDFSLSSTRLVGGTQPIQMQVIYSSYQ